MKSKLLAILFFSLGVMAVLTFFWPGAGGNLIEIVVAPKETAKQVAENLKENGLLNSRYPFLVWTRIRRGESKIKVGHYRFMAGRSAFWLVDDLVKGRTVKVKFTIPEGSASWQIAERLNLAGLSNEKEFLDVVHDKKLEGYLFPATYDFDLGLEASALTKRMTDEFERRWTPDFESRAAELKMTKNQVVTLASILEREIRVREELPMISAVYHNRLRIKMRLDADPTVQYALGFWKKRLTYDDYKSTQSPYNTYLNAGLPPGPICSPSLDAIKAALWPAASEALYMLAQEDGHHTFSTSYREHTNKVNVRNHQTHQVKKERKK